MNLLRVQVRGSFEEFRGVSVFGFFRITSFFRRPKIGYRCPKLASEAQIGFTRPQIGFPFAQNWLLLDRGQNWLGLRGPKLASEGQNWLEKASEAQIGFRMHKIRRPKLASDGFRKKEAQIGFRRKPKIGFRRQKLSSGPNWLWKAQNWLQKDQNSKLTSEGLLKLGFRRPKLASEGQNWLQKAKIGFSRPKLASAGQNLPQKAQIGSKAKIGSRRSKIGFRRLKIWLRRPN